MNDPEVSSSFAQLTRIKRINAVTANFFIKTKIIQNAIIKLQNMKGLAFSSMRVGETYSLVNFGEISEFKLIEVLNRNDYKLQDIHTLELYTMSDLVRFGKGEDFELRELNQ